MQAQIQRKAIIALILASSLLGCGGGDEPNIVDKPVKPAAVAVAFPTNCAAPPLTPNTVRSLIPLLSLGIDNARELGQLTMTPIFADDVYMETIAGPDGGSVYVEAVSHRSGLGDWLHLVFDRYMVNGVEVNGAVLEEITGASDATRQFPYRISFYDYTVTGPISQVTLTGTVERHPADADQQVLEANVAIRDGFSESGFYLQNFMVRDVEYPLSATTSRTAVEVEGLILEADASGTVVAFDVETLPDDGLHYISLDSVVTSLRGSLQLAGDESAVMDIAFLNAYLVHATVREAGTVRGYRLSMIQDEVADGALGALDRPIATASRGGATDDAFVGTEQALDARFSAGRESVPLSYAWDLIYRPAGSIVTVEGATEPFARFVPDAPGDYLFRLTVSDGVNATDDLLEVRVTEPDMLPRSSNTLADSRGQLIPYPGEPDQWVVDTRAAIDTGVFLARPDWSYTVLGEWDEYVDVVDQVSAHIDLIDAQGLTVGYGCCSTGMFTLKEALDRQDFAPRLHEPFQAMDLPMESIDTTWTILHAEMEDMDGDGFLDLLATPAQIGVELGYPDENLPGVYVRRGLANGGFGETEWLNVGDGSRFAVGDVDGDNVMDIVAEAENCSFDVAFGTGSEFSASDNISLMGTCEAFGSDRQYGRRDFLIRDLDSDGQPTIITIAANNRDIDLIDIDGFGNVTSRRTIAVSAAIGEDESLIQHAVALDMNLDDMVDIAVSVDSDTWVMGRPVFLLQNGDGTFSVSEQEEMVSHYGPRLSIGDFDGDGQDDLAVGIYKSVKVWKSGSGGPVIIYDDSLDNVSGAHHLGTDWLSFMDINGDGDDELLLLGNLDNWVQAVDRDSEGTIHTAWMMLPNASYSHFSGQGMVAPPAAEDMDHDGFLDFVLFHQSGVFVAFGRQE